MPLPESLQGDKWTKYTARKIFPLLVWCAKNGYTITYGQLDEEIVNRGWGHHVMAIQYGSPAGTIGEAIPPINALIINKKYKLPGDGINWYLERYYDPDKDIYEMTLDEKRAIVEEIHADIFSYHRWDEILEIYEIEPFEGNLNLEEINEDISPPSKGGWSNEAESKEHKKLKEYISMNPQVIGLNKNTKNGITEYLFSSSARTILVTERKLPISLQNLADILGIKVVLCKINA